MDLWLLSRALFLPSLSLPLRNGLARLRPLLLLDRSPSRPPKSGLARRNPRDRRNPTESTTSGTERERTLLSSKAIMRVR